MFEVFFPEEEAARLGVDNGAVQGLESWAAARGKSAVSGSSGSSLREEEERAYGVFGSGSGVPLGLGDTERVCDSFLFGVTEASCCPGFSPGSHG